MFLYIRPSTDCWLSFCPFSFGHCVFCPSIYRFDYLPLVSLNPSYRQFNNDHLFNKTSRQLFPSSPISITEAKNSRCLNKIKIVRKHAVHMYIGQPWYIPSRKSISLFYTCTNYRPISVLPVISKLIEKYISRHTKCISGLGKIQSSTWCPIWF
jgi:hypothetical protein